MRFLLYSMMYKMISCIVITENNYQRHIHFLGIKPFILNYIYINYDRVPTHIVMRRYYNSTILLDSTTTILLENFSPVLVLYIR